MHIEGHEIVSREVWLEQRERLLAKEKELNKLRDQLSAERRSLPWVRVEEDYAFEGEGGRLSLAELFAGRGQLIVYHFMFDPEWEAGCKSCSFWADNFERNVVHLSHRDVTVAAVSRAPIAKLSAYKRRMGWTFPWVSSFGTTFNYDFGVSFTPEQVATGEVTYNYAKQKAHGGELPGLSVFARGDDDTVYHTYSTYSRGLDMLNAAYHCLDLVPRGRDEGGRIMSWLRRRDEYDR